MGWPAAGVVVMRPRPDDSGGTPTLVTYSGVVVDLGRLAEIGSALDAALGAARSAARALWLARLLVGGTAGLAPLSAPRALAALDDARHALAGVEDRLEGLRQRVAAARAVYEEAESTAAAIMARPPSPGPVFGMLLPARGAAHWVAGGVLRGLLLGVEAVMDARRGVPLQVNAQAHLRDGARLLGPAVNPTGRVLLPRGWVPLGATTPVEFLTSSVLDLTGLDHFGGSVDVWAAAADGARVEPPLGVHAVPLGASAAISPVRSVGEVLGRIRTTAAAADRNRVGRIELVAQRGAAGTTAWTMVLPGTREQFMAANPQDHLSNVQLMADERDDLLLAAREVLAMAPIGPQDPVVLVGHSQGGIVAAELAADPEVGVHVAGVVSVGSPIGQVDIPDAVPVISLENLDDVVPALDGLANPVAPNRVTLQFDGAAHSAVLGAHDLRTYEAAYDRALAQGVDARLTGADADLRALAHWDDPDATARVFTFEFARTDRLGSLLETIRHAGYERR